MIRSSAVTGSDRWPSSRCRCTRVFGMCSASHCPCVKGTIRSCCPCHRSLDLREVESPVAYKRQIIVTPTRDAVRDGVPEAGGQEVGEDASQRALVDVRYQAAQGRAK